MSNIGALEGGAFVTSLEGRRCTAVPKPGGGGGGEGGNNNNGGNGNANSNAGEQTSTSFSGGLSSLDINTNVLSVQAEATGSVESTTSSSLVQTAIPPPSRPTASFFLAQGQDNFIPPQVVAFAPENSSSASQAISPETSIPQEQSIPTVPAASSPAETPAESLASVTQDSDTDDNNAATLATIPTVPTATPAEAPLEPPAATPAEVTPPPATELQPPSATELAPNQGGAQVFTTIGTAGITEDAAAAANTAPTTNSVASVESSTGNAESTIAVAGGVIGGVALISLVAFLIWFWRRRVIRKRRSTLLTPLDIGPGPGGAGGRGEKGAYEINRGSIGPTPRAERIKASFDYNIKRIRSRFSRLMPSQGSNSLSSVNMNRGNSQFMEDTLRRQPTNASSTRRPQMTAKDKLSDWWSGVTAKASLGRGKSPEPADPFAAAREKKEVDLTKQPDFLTLLGMDERELEREAQKKRAGDSGRVSPASSKSDAAALGSSAPHFLSDLNLSFGNNEDPFSDANALAHNSAKPAPLVVSQANNPFSDANAIKPGPSTYVQNIRRSRGQSVDDRGPGPAGPSGLPMRGESVYRESVNSVDTYATRRNNKFRSDPFDLERPELLLRGQKTTSSNMSTAGSSVPPRLSDVPSADGLPRRPRMAHQRSESFTSKYSSGFSLGDWSDPGPDVGPAAGSRWDDSNQGNGRNSGGSQGSNGVGRAL
jgi:hypothetical protein